MCPTPAAASGGKHKRGGRVQFGRRPTTMAAAAAAAVGAFCLVRVHALVTRGEMNGSRAAANARARAHCKNNAPPSCLRARCRNALERQTSCWCCWRARFCRRRRRRCRRRCRRRAHCWRARRGVGGAHRNGFPAQWKRRCTNVANCSFLLQEKSHAAQSVHGVAVSGTPKRQPRKPAVGLVANSRRGR